MTRGRGTVHATGQDRNRRQAGGCTHGERPPVGGGVDAVGRPGHDGPAAGHEPGREVLGHVLAVGRGRPCPHQGGGRWCLSGSGQLATHPQADRAPAVRSVAGSEVVQVGQTAGPHLVGRDHQPNARPRGRGHETCRGRLEPVVPGLPHLTALTAAQRLHQLGRGVGAQQQPEPPVTRLDDPGQVRTSGAVVVAALGHGRGAAWVWAGPTGLGRAHASDAMVRKETASATSSGPGRSTPARSAMLHATRRARS